MFVTSNEVIEQCLEKDVLGGLRQLLFSGNADLIKKTLWSLSNICAGTPEQAVEVL